MVCYLAPPCVDLSIAKECSQGRETHLVLANKCIQYWVKHYGVWAGFVSLFLSQQQFQSIIIEQKLPFITTTALKNETKQTKEKTKPV